MCRYPVVCVIPHWRYGKCTLTVIYFRVLSTFSLQSLRTLSVRQMTPARLRFENRDDFTTPVPIAGCIFSTAVDLSYTFSEIALPTPRDDEKFCCSQTERRGGLRRECVGRGGAREGEEGDASAIFRNLAAILRSIQVKRYNAYLLWFLRVPS